MGVLILGLTGGIASGKSTVSRALAERGAVVIDADLIAREVVAPGTAGLAAVLAEFGTDLQRPDGSLDREALGRVVFADDQARARLSAIVHPLIGTRSAELWAAAEAAGTDVLVHDVPLLVESGLQDSYDEVIVVDVPPEVQLDRLVGLRGMDPVEAQQRIAAQASREQRLAAATQVIVNDGSLDDLAAA
ncbi:MAG: dephospho-CoA kinase, partial [Frankiales bacterium]|nr:dephospho-CoA kinase [Frankiales bacterium]